MHSTFAVSRGSGTVAAASDGGGSVTTDGYGAQEYRKIRGQTHAAATAQPPSSPRRRRPEDEQRPCGRRRAEADSGRAYRESNRGCRFQVARCRRQWLQPPPCHRARRRTPPPSCRALPPPEAVAAMSPPARRRHRARRGQYCAYWQQQCLAKLGRSPLAGPAAVGVTKIFVFRFFSSLLRTFSWSPLFNAFKKISRWAIKATI